MKTDQLTQPTAAVFPQLVSNAVTRLKQKLQQDYEQAYPDLREIVHLVLDEEESTAWDLSPFPHLLLPDLVEAHLTSLNLHRVGARHHATDRDEAQTYESAFAVCG
jgi:hypothetical protein